MQRAAPGWRRVVAAAASAGIPVPALAASLAYFDSYRTARLPQNLTQAQRDAFGAHKFERVETTRVRARRLGRLTEADRFTGDQEIRSS